MFSSKGGCNVMNNSFKVLLKLDKKKCAILLEG